MADKKGKPKAKKITKEEKRPKDGRNYIQGYMTDREYNAMVVEMRALPYLLDPAISPEEGLKILQKLRDMEERHTVNARKRYDKEFKKQMKEYWADHPINNNGHTI